VTPEAARVRGRQPPSAVSFGPFSFDPQSRLLWREGTEIALPPRVLGVLELLIERSGQIVARQDLLDRVWKDAFVTDTSLAEAVSFLRQALGDDPQSPRYIQTVHRRGYRFVAPLGSDQGQTGVRLGSDWGQTTFAEPTPTATRPEPTTHPERAGAPVATQLLPWTVAILAIALTISAVWNNVRRKSPEPAPVTRFEVRPEAGTWFDRRAPALAVASDGRTLAWSACEATTGTCGLFVRQIDKLEPVRLAGTDGAASPFFSPDGRWLAFFADGKLKKVAVSGGSPIVLADAPAPAGGAWNDEGQIVFSGLPAGGLSIVADQGGEVTPLTAPQFAKGEVRHVWPSWLPGNGAILFTIATSPVPGAPGQLAVLSPTSRTWRTLRPGVTRATPAGPGYLLVASGSDLQAVTYDERATSLTGASDSVFDALATADGAPQFAAGGGMLVALRAPAGPRTIEWSDTLDRTIPSAGPLAQPALAPDGRRLAAVAADVTGSDIWTVDLDTGTKTRATFGGVNASPVWDARGGLIYATKSKDGVFAIPSRSVDPGDTHLFPVAAAADGRVAAVRTSNDGHATLVLLAPGAPPATIANGPFDELSAAFSPDSASIAYDSDESGRREVYLQRFDSSPRTQVSTAGGERPAWSRDGRAIYVHEGARLTRITLSAEGRPVPGTRAIVFDRPDARVLGVTPDGRVLIERQPPALDAAVVVLQWLREVRERLPLPVAAPR
jgi:DNA-binding winged helix-turn-helix (wHTH) protein/Tol biopolymer transport system component